MAYSFALLHVSLLYFGNVNLPSSFKRLHGDSIVLVESVSLIYVYAKIHRFSSPQNGNIAEFLLSEGLARCVDWSMGVVTTGTERLRAAEK